MELKQNDLKMYSFLANKDSFIKKKMGQIGKLV